MEEPPPLPHPLPTHLVMGRPCQHGSSPQNPYMARVKVAHSLGELVEAVQDGESLVVTLAWGNVRSINEICAFAVEKYILTVIKSDMQCRECAINLAHCIGALVLVA